MTRHEAAHHLPFKCDECDKLFSCMSSKHRHVREVHSPTVSCDIGFFKPVGPPPPKKRRVKQCRAKIALYCDKCNYQTCDRSNFARHKASHFKKKKPKHDEKHTCTSKCRYSSIRKYNTSRHMKTC